MKCPICKEEIEENAQKCKHCGSYVKVVRRIWGGIRSFLQFVTLVAAIVVLYFMWQGNRIMQDSVEEARRSVEQGREAVELTKVSVAKIDTGFALTREQIDIQQEQLNLQRKSVEELSKEFVEEKRPRIEISVTKIDSTDTGSILYVDFDNKGFADAEDILIYLVLKYEDAPKDTLGVGLTRVTKITKARPLSYSWRLPTLKRVNLTSFIEVRYTWTIQNLDYKEPKYCLFVYDKELQEYRIRVLDDEQSKELWE